MGELRQIVLTGLSSELGAVIARRYAVRDGFKVIGTMRRPRSAQDNFSANVTVIDQCDLTDEACCKDLASEVDNRFTGPFGFVHCVGEFWNHVPFLQVDQDDADAMFRSHVNTLYNTMQALIPLMKTSGGGSCVAFSCNSVRYNYPWMAAFTAAKSAVDSLVRSLAHEFAGDRIRINALVLASLQTQKVKASKPFGDFQHFVDPEDIVPLVRFLMDDAAEIVNGNCINVFRHSPDFYQKGYFERVRT